MTIHSQKTTAAVRALVTASVVLYCASSFATTSVAVTPVAVSTSTTEGMEGPFIQAFVKFQSESYKGISAIVHPDQGVSVYYTPSSPEVKFTASEFATIASSTKQYTFGTAPGSGASIKITAHQFFFGKRTAVPSSQGPLPNWGSIFVNTSDFALNRPLTTGYEGTSHIPTKFVGKPYWTVRYPGTSANSNFDFSEARLVFDTATVSGKSVYRLVAIVCAAPYSP